MHIAAVSSRSFWHDSICVCYTFIYGSCAPAPLQPRGAVAMHTGGFLGQSWHTPNIFFLICRENGFCGLQGRLPARLGEAGHQRGLSQNLPGAAHPCGEEDEAVRTPCCACWPPALPRGTDRRMDRWTDRQTTDGPVQASPACAAGVAFCCCCCSKRLEHCNLTVSS